MASREIFVDTAGWANYFVRSEPLHIASKDLMAQAKSQRTNLITTNYVLSELVALMTSPIRVPRPLLITMLRAIRTADWITVVHIDPALDRRAWELLELG